MLFELSRFDSWICGVTVELSDENMNRSMSGDGGAKSICRITVIRLLAFDLEASDIGANPRGSISRVVDGVTYVADHPRHTELTRTII